MSNLQEKNWLPLRIRGRWFAAGGMRGVFPAAMLMLAACSAEIDQKVEAPPPSANGETASDVDRAPAADGSGAEAPATGGGGSQDAGRRQAEEQARIREEAEERRRRAEADAKAKMARKKVASEGKVGMERPDTEPTTSGAQPPSEPPPVADAAPPPDPTAPGGASGGSRSIGGTTTADEDVGRTRGLGASNTESADAEPEVAAEEGESAAGGDKDKFDVVPVYFGTDRERKANDKRLEYGSERARVLELGRALVTVPRAHKVPMIERPWVVKIPYFEVVVYSEEEDPERHFTMKEIKSMTREELLQLVRDRLKSSTKFKDHALLFVHGYNTSFDTAVYRTAQIAYDLKFDGAPFLYSWPSGGGFASYTYDQNSAAQSEPFMRKFLEMVVNETGAKKVSVIAHSMGNQPLLRVLQSIKSSKPDSVVISQLILAAPDVDRHNFENIVSTIKGLAEGVTLYAANNDKALIASRAFHGGARAGDVPENGPIVMPEVLDTIDVSAVSTDSLGLRHSGYAENNALLNDIGLLIQTGERPPVARVPILEKRSTANGDYWRYPGAGE